MLNYTPDCLPAEFRGVEFKEKMVQGGFLSTVERVSDSPSVEGLSDPSLSSEHATLRARLVSQKQQSQPTAERPALATSEPARKTFSAPGGRILSQISDRLLIGGKQLSQEDIERLQSGKGDSRHL